MLKKVYIVGKIPKYIDKETRNQFSFAKEYLLKIGFKNIINPLDNFKNNDSSSQESIKRNLKLLLECEVAYILPSVNYKVKNFELDIVSKLNLLTIQGTIMINKNNRKNEYR